MTGARSCAVTQTWGDGEYRFRLGIGELEELDRLTGAGPEHLLAEMLAGRARARWHHHILRLGLIGGGTPPVEALRLVRLYCDERPWLESKDAAAAVMMGLLVGRDEEDGAPAGEPPAAAENASGVGSTSPASSEPAS
jgi:hypothetical protein